MTCSGRSGSNPSGGRWIVCGSSIAGTNIRLEGNFPGPLTIHPPGPRMRRVNCDRCFKYHRRDNLACFGNTRIRGIKYRPRQIYSVATGEIMPWRLVRVDGHGRAWAAAKRI